MRWPLRLHFFGEDVFVRWGRYCAAPGVEPLRKTLEVVTDFDPSAAGAAGVVEGKAQGRQRKKRRKKGEVAEAAEDESAGEAEEKAADEVAEAPRWGVHVLPLDHAPLAPYLEKGQDITTFEREGNCVVCQQQLEHDKGLYAICSNGTCEAVGHLDCWSRYLLHQQCGDDADGIMLPMEGQCPRCGEGLKWANMMRELTLRLRGQDEVDKTLKRFKRAAGKSKTKSKGKGKAKAKVDDES